MSTNGGGGLFGCRSILCVESVAHSIVYYVAESGVRRPEAMMGCDIRAVIDYEDSPGYVYAFADGALWPPRDYNLDPPPHF
jgi:hypothetical protein